MHRSSQKYGYHRSQKNRQSRPLRRNKLFAKVQHQASCLGYGPPPPCYGPPPPCFGLPPPP